MKVISGATGIQLFSFFAYDPNFTGGVNVAGGDLNGDGRADIVTGAGAGGGPYVKVFSGLDNSTLDSFFAFDVRTTSGVGVGTGQVNADNSTDIIVVGPDNVVRELDGQTLNDVRDFFAPGGNPFLGSSGTVSSFVAGNATADGDAVLDADTVTLEAIRTANLPPPVASAPAGHGVRRDV